MDFAIKGPAGIEVGVEAEFEAIGSLGIVNWEIEDNEGVVGSIDEDGYP